MKHIIRATVILIILYIIGNHYSNDFRYNDGIVNLIWLFAVIAFIYLIAAIIGAVRRAIVFSRATGVPAQPAAKSSGCSLLLLLLLLLALTYVFRTALGTYSFRSFHTLDRLLQLGTGISPVVSWGLLGLLAGSLFGSFVAWKKYKLNATVNLIPIGILALVLAILYLVNKPLESGAFDNNSNTQIAYAYNLVTAEVYNAAQDNNAMYKPSFLLDSIDKTAWITDISKGTAEIRFSFKGLENYANKDLQCVGFLIKNGYRKSPLLWDNFARAKEIVIRHNGRFITVAVVNDKNSDMEEIKIVPVHISSFDNISISMNAVYPGEKYPTRVAISELVPIIQYEKL